MYLFAAPLGVVPCATLYLVVGLALIGGGRAHRSFSDVLAALGLLYGLIGVARLGVWLDIGLVIGAATLLLAAHQRSTPEASRRLTS